jgi:hypothetical protein
MSLHTDASSATRALPAFAGGGYHAGGMALVGEDGPEVVDFGAPARIYTADQSRNMLAGGGNTQALESHLLRLIAAVERLEAQNSAENRAIAQHAARAAKVLEQLTDKKPVYSKGKTRF